MAKLWVTSTLENNKVPFLRGILTRSLTDAGLSFEDAYAVSSDIRDSLEDNAKVSTEEIRQEVSAYLAKNFDKDICQSYDLPDTSAYSLMVQGLDQQWEPFYRSQHLRCLESCGLNQEQAANSTNDILMLLQDQEITEVTVSGLGRLTYDYLLSNYGKKIAHRYLVWIDHVHSGRPLILLIGGTTGSGKSTIATEVAHRLGIVRTQSTDMLREVMRTMIPKRLLPVLHKASFNAGEAIPAAVETEEDEEAQLTSGYLTQSELLTVSCEAVIQRALRERVSLILEGVHVHPSLLDRVEDKSDAVVVMVVMAILRQKQLKSRLSGRFLEAPERETDEQLTQFSRIWQMQSVILAEADKMGITILSNDDKEQVTNRVMTSVIDELSHRFKSTPDEVFPQDQ